MLTRAKDWMMMPTAMTGSRRSVHEFQNDAMANGSGSLKRSSIVEIRCRFFLNALQVWFDEREREDKELLRLA